MRTTLDIEGPVLKELKRLQKSTGQSLGRLASDLLARALATRDTTAEPRFLCWTTQDLGEMNDLINKVQRDYHTASIIITHDLTCAKVTGHRVAMLLDGRMLRVGTFEEVFNSSDPRVKGFYDYNFTE